ncbi:hypothetical protein [Cohnella mopanensis]|uniref:hypothetical protein n=1 Tax=Cohnella mopanensis TaxID=2911966 RepID=UPI001EF95E60|nr:hypothetical protein [Cohnella mopanensis]
MTIDQPRIHGAIILATMFIFFPVGIVLLIIRFAVHFKYNHLRAMDYRLTGHSFVTFFAAVAGIILLASAGSSTMTSSDVTAVLIVFAIVLGLPAFVFYVLGASRKKKMTNLYNLYYNITTAQGVDSLDRISELTGENVRNVTQDLSYMIASGKLLGATLDPANRVVKLSGRTGSSSGTPATATRSEIVVNGPRGSASPVATQPITCSGCGSASRVVPGESKDCEFCGNVLFVPA